MNFTRMRSAECGLYSVHCTDRTSTSNYYADHTNWTDFIWVWNYSRFNGVSQQNTCWMFSNISRMTNNCCRPVHHHFLAQKTCSSLPLQPPHLDKAQISWFALLHCCPRNLAPVASCVEPNLVEFLSSYRNPVCSSEVCQISKSQAILSASPFAVALFENLGETIASMSL